MNQSGDENTITFRAGAEKEAANLLDEIHLSSVDVSELARTGLGEMLRRTLNHRDKIGVDERYSRGESDEDVTRVLLGTAIDRMEEEKEAFETAMDHDTSSFLTERGLLP